MLHLFACVLLSSFHILPSSSEPGPGDSDASLHYYSFENLVNITFSNETGDAYWTIKTTGNRLALSADDTRNTSEGNYIRLRGKGDATLNISEVHVISTACLMFAYFVTDQASINISGHFNDGSATTELRIEGRNFTNDTTWEVAKMELNSSAVITFHCRKENNMAEVWLGDILVLHEACNKSQATEGIAVWLISSMTDYSLLPERTWMKSRQSSKLTSETNLQQSLSFLEFSSLLSELAISESVTHTTWQAHKQASFMKNAIVDSAKSEGEMTHLSIENDFILSGRNSWVVLSLSVSRPLPSVSSELPSDIFESTTSVLFPSSLTANVPISLYSADIATPSLNLAYSQSTPEITDHLTSRFNVQTITVATHEHRPSFQVIDATVLPQKGSEILITNQSSHVNTHMSSESVMTEVSSLTESHIWSNLTSEILEHSMMLNDVISSVHFIQPVQITSERTPESNFHITATPTRPTEDLDTSAAYITTILQTTAQYTFDQWTQNTRHATDLQEWVIPVTASLACSLLVCLLLAIGLCCCRYQRARSQSRYAHSDRENRFSPGLHTSEQYRVRTHGPLTFLHEDEPWSTAAIMLPSQPGCGDFNSRQEDHEMVDLHKPTREGKFYNQPDSKQFLPLGSFVASYSAESVLHSGLDSPDGGTNANRKVKSGMYVHQTTQTSSAHEYECEKQVLSSSVRKYVVNRDLYSESENSDASEKSYDVQTSDDNEHHSKSFYNEAYISDAHDDSTITHNVNNVDYFNGERRRLNNLAAGLLAARSFIVSNDDSQYFESRDSSKLNRSTDKKPRLPKCVSFDEVQLDSTKAVTSNDKPTRKISSTSESAVEYFTVPESDRTKRKSIYETYNNLAEIGNSPASTFYIGSRADSIGLIGSIKNQVVPANETLVSGPDHNLKNKETSDARERFDRVSFAGEAKAVFEDMGKRSSSADYSFPIGKASKSKKLAERQAITFIGNPAQELNDAVNDKQTAINNHNLTHIGEIQASITNREANSRFSADPSQLNPKLFELSSNLPKIILTENTDDDVDKNENIHVNPSLPVPRTRRFAKANNPFLIEVDSVQADNSGKVRRSSVPSMPARRTDVMPSELGIECMSRSASGTNIGEYKSDSQAELDPRLWSKKFVRLIRSSMQNDSTNEERFKKMIDERYHALFSGKYQTLSGFNETGKHSSSLNISPRIVKRFDAAKLREQKEDEGKTVGFHSETGTHSGNTYRESNLDQSNYPQVGNASTWSSSNLGNDAMQKKTPHENLVGHNKHILLQTSQDRTAIEYSVDALKHIPANLAGSTDGSYKILPPEEISSLDKRKTGMDTDLAFNGAESLRSRKKTLLSDVKWESFEDENERPISFSSDSAVTCNSDLYPPGQSNPRGLNELPAWNNKNVGISHPDLVQRSDVSWSVDKSTRDVVPHSASSHGPGLTSELHHPSFNSSLEKNYTSNTIDTTEAYAVTSLENLPNSMAEKQEASLNSTANRKKSSPPVKPRRKRPIQKQLKGIGRRRPPSPFMYPKQQLRLIEDQADVMTDIVGDVNSSPFMTQTQTIRGFHATNSPRYHQAGFSKQGNDTEHENSDQTFKSGVNNPMRISGPATQKSNQATSKSGEVLFMTSANNTLLEHSSSEDTNWGDDVSETGLSFYGDSFSFSPGQTEEAVTDYEKIIDPSTRFKARQDVIMREKSRISDV